MKIAIVVLSRSGLELARRLQPELDGAVVHGLAGRADGADVPFTDTLGHLRGLFAEGTAIIGIFAAGITIRALGPNLANKKTESPVIALVSMFVLVALIVVIGVYPSLVSDTLSSAASELLQRATYIGRVLG